jgi:hypothetical protein
VRFIVNNLLSQLITPFYSLYGMVHHLREPPLRELLPELLLEPPELPEPPPELLEPPL